MQKKFILFLTILTLTLLVACGNDDSNADKEKKSNEEELLALEVDLETPEKTEVDEKANLNATVSYGDEKVTDADEVEYETWEKGAKDDSEMIEAKNNKDGTYSLDKKFDKDGEYEVQVHVTARDQHTMPKATIQVGKGGSKEQTDSDNEQHHKTEEFSMHFMETKDIKSNDTEKLMVHLELKNKPFKDSKVRYEIVRDNEKKSEWIDANENKPGEYTGEFKFAEKGTYKITIHVEDEKDLHEHEEHEIKVK